MNIVHMFFYEYCEIITNAYFEENLWTAASEQRRVKFFIYLFEGCKISVS